MVSLRSVLKKLRWERKKALHEQFLLPFFLRLTFIWPFLFECYSATFLSFSLIVIFALRLFPFKSYIVLFSTLLAFDLRLSLFGSFFMVILDIYCVLLRCVIFTTEFPLPADAGNPCQKLIHCFSPMENIIEPPYFVLSATFLVDLAISCGTLSGAVIQPRMMFACYVL